MVVKRVEHEVKFKKGIKHLKNVDIKKRIKKLIKKLVKEPTEKHHLRYEKSKEQKIYIGKYRLLYTYEGETLRLIDFDHRNKVYKKS